MYTYVYILLYMYMLRVERKIHDVELERLVVDVFNKPIKRKAKKERRNLTNTNKCLCYRTRWILLWLFTCNIMYIREQQYKLKNKCENIAFEWIIFHIFDSRMFFFLFCFTFVLCVMHTTKEWLIFICVHIWKNDQNAYNATVWLLIV